MTCPVGVGMTLQNRDDNSGSTARGVLSSHFGRGFAEAGEGWGQRDLRAVRMTRTPKAVTSKRPPQLAALICFSLGGLIGIRDAGPITTGDDLSSDDLSSDA